MADKKKKDYGMNVDFNSYGLKPAGSYIDSLKHLNDMLDTIAGGAGITTPKTDLDGLKSSMDEADEAAKKLLREMGETDALSPNAPKTKAEEEPERPNLDELLAELDSLVGLDKIKQNVRSLINLAKVRKLREEQGLPTPNMSLHLVFMGNPGTGKTTVARLVAQLYYAIGVLSKGQLVEVEQAGAVGVGHRSADVEGVQACDLTRLVRLICSRAVGVGGEADARALHDLALGRRRRGGHLSSLVALDIGRLGGEVDPHRFCRDKVELKLEI